MINIRTKIQNRNRYVLSGVNKFVSIKLQLKFVTCVMNKVTL